MRSRSPVGVTAGQAAGMSVRLEGVCVTDVTIWLWTNRYKFYGAKHFFRTIMQGTVTQLGGERLETRPFMSRDGRDSNITWPRIQCTLLPVLNYLYDFQLNHHCTNRGAMETLWIDPWMR